MRRISRFVLKNAVLSIGAIMRRLRMVSVSADGALNRVCRFTRTQKQRVHRIGKDLTIRGKIPWKPFEVSKSLPVRKTEPRMDSVLGTPHKP